MAFRNIYIANPVALSIHHEQLELKTNAIYTIPLEDIATLILENLQSTLTAYTLSKLSQYNIMVYVCDKKHLPCGILHSFNQHSRQLGVINYQIQSSQPFKKRLWQQIVKQKITNQGKCLEYREKYHQADYLYALADTVQSGDKDNKESIAAKYYFKELYGEGFTRDEDLKINNGLDYGYAIIRGAVARGLITYGLQPSMGLWHHSELNAFNLADDFIEPLRPVVDLWVANYYEVLEEDLSPSNKESLISLLGHDMQIDGARHSLHNVIDKMLKSYVTALRHNQPTAKLMLPELIPLQEHQYE